MNISRDCFLTVYTYFVITIVICAADNERFKTVETLQGLVKGYVTDGVYSFYGIPFATAPTGISKFMDPLPGPSWSNTFEAVNNTIACQQIRGYRNGTEDCLVANVFLPDTEETGLPVVVSVHGGAYSREFGNMITPLSLVKEGNIIFVSGNYRLFFYGFLCLGTDPVPGNAALKDALALLKWVNRNIRSFGGNPDDVTLAGFSAGASMVSLLMLSEAANGLYNKVIMESGSGYGSWGVAMDPIESAAAIAHLEGIDTRDVSVLEDFYLNTAQHSHLGVEHIGPVDGSIYFSPCIEQVTRTGAVLTDTPHNVLKNANFQKVPTLISITDMEGIFKVDLFDTMIERINGNFSEFLPADLQFSSQEERDAIAKKVKEFYFGEEPVGTNSRQGFIDLTTDTHFSHSAHRTVRELVAAGNDEVYYYFFTYHEPGAIGANHCDQTYIIYDDIPFSSDESQISDNRKQMKEVIREMWLNFVKNGKPVPEASAEYPSGWPAAGAAGSPYMEVALPPRLRHDLLLQERFAFWDQIYEGRLREPVPPPFSDIQTPINGGTLSSIFMLPTIILPLLTVL